MKPTKVNGLYDIILPAHRADRPQWHTEEGWERARLDHIHKTTRQGDIVYYVGAEEGDMAGLISMWGAELVLFEPNPKVSPNIKAIWQANNLKTPLAYFEGFAADKNSGGGALYRNSFPPSADGELIGDHGFKELAYESDVIPCIRIDDVVKDTGLKPSMISMDVEGSEFEVLKGARQTLETYRPRIYLSLHPEFLFRMFDVYSFDVRQWIIKLGYKETLLDYQHECHFVYEAL